MSFMIMTQLWKSLTVTSAVFCYLYRSALIQYGRGIPGHEWHEYQEAKTTGAILAGKRLFNWFIVVADNSTSKLDLIPYRYSDHYDNQYVFLR